MATTYTNGVAAPSPGDQIPSDGASAWQLVASTADAAIGAAKFTKGRVASGGDVFTYAAGVHTIGSATAAENTANLPEAYPGTLVVLGNPGEVLRAAHFYPYTRDYFWWSVTTMGSTWMPWQKVGRGEGMSALGSGVTNSLLVQDFSRRRGGTWSTGGKAAVSLRLDHGLGNFRDKLKPILDAAGMVPSLALNSRNWDREENGGVTASTVNGWVSAGDVEVWNHSATHSNPTTEAGVWDEVVTGLAELRAQLPAAQIDGWAIPGVGTDPYLGMGSLTSVQQIYESYAGRLILEHHAVTTGHIDGTWQRVLDGTVRQAQRHYGLDTKTFAEAKAEIDAAVTNGTGLQLMLHPSTVDGTGNITTARFQQIVDYIVARRNAGELIVCSPYEMALADSTVPAGVDVDAALAAYQAAIA